MTKRTSTIDQHRQAIGKHENKRPKPKKLKPLVPSDVHLNPLIHSDASLKPQQAASKEVSENLTTQQKLARDKQKAAQRRTEQNAHVNILPTAALTVLVMLILFPQPVETRKESKQKSVSRRDGIPRVSLTTLEQKGQAQNVFFPEGLVEGYRYKTMGIGFDSTAHLLALLQAETPQHYAHAKGKVDSQPIVKAAMRRVNLTQTEDCLINTSLNATCANTGLVSLPGRAFGENSASAATNGKKAVFNIGPLIPDDNICRDTTDPMYLSSTNPSRGAVIYNEAVYLPNQALTTTSPRDYYAPWGTLKTGLELVDAEHVNLLGAAEDTLLVKGVVVKQENAVVASTLYVNQYDSTIARTYIDIDPLCVVTNAGEIIQSKLSVVVDEDGQVKRRDLILAHLPTPDSSDAKVIIISDIDHRQGQNIDLNADPGEQNIQVLSGFNWGDAKTRGNNLIDIIDQEIENLDAHSSGLDESSAGLELIRQRNLLIVSSSGQADALPHSRPRAFIIDVETNTRIGIQDQSDVANSSDLGYAVISTGELSQKFPEDKWLYSNYPTITRPGTGELFVLSPQKIAIMMAKNKGATVLVDVSQLSELIIDDPEVRCPEFGKKLFTNEDTAQLGMQCDHTENSTTMEVLDFQQVVDSPANRLSREKAATSSRTARTSTASEQFTAGETDVLPVVNCGSFWRKNAVPLAAIGATTAGMLTLVGCTAYFFFRKPKEAGDIEASVVPINADRPEGGANERTPLMTN